MRKTLIGLSCVVIIFTIAAVPTLATKPASPGKSAAASSAAPKIKPSTVKSSAAQGKSAAPKAKTPSTKPAKTTKTTTPKAAKSTSAKATTPGTAKSSGDAVLPAPGTWVPTNPIAQKLSTKQNLLTRIQDLLPKGADLNLATVGYKSFGQFVASANVSDHLGIDFWKLKASMTGLDPAGLPTGQPTRSLGQSIQSLKTGVNGPAEAQRAETLANQMIADSGN